LGTAGHVDHGKSSLVRALTGTNPDRWIEEQLRGMTLDLGFAHLRFDDGVEAGIVDVPGHERFLHNMLAGAAGMELLLLVVAANEGPRPQTLEHLAILQYLNVRRTIVVLTKSDLVDADELAIGRDLIHDALTGSIAADAPVLAVSTVTGDGLDALRAAIHDALAVLPPRAPQAPVYLPIDRVFGLAGHGTIVTGTLMQGTIAAGDQLQLAPLGRVVRARSLQVFGARQDRVEGGARVAVNLPGIETGEIARGAVLASPEVEPRATVDVAFRALADALPILRRRTPVRAYIGAAEIIGTLVFDAVPIDTSAVSARLHLRAPTVAITGGAFVVRRLSPKTLLGGGTIVQLDAAAHEAETDDPPEVAELLAALADASTDGATAARIGMRANLREERATEILEQLVEDGRVYRLTRPPAYVQATAADALYARVLAATADSEQATPWAMGLTSIALARRLQVPEQQLVRILVHAIEEGRIAYRAGYYSSPQFGPQLNETQRAFFDRVVSVDPAQPYLPTAFDAIAGAMKTAQILGLSQAFDSLVAGGALVKIGDAIYRGTQVAEIRAKLEAKLKRDRQLTMADFRDIVGTSRKYAVPLLEWFDATGVTMRNGDLRILRQRG
ncbi:MAG: selenocysteine-specific translation elongation factor, partial [Vulcanimicrobiaceae bacterium]